MRLQRTKDTAPEILLRRLIHAHGLRFRLHQRLLPDVRRTADIVLRGPRVVVDVRGCFWHGCPEHCRRGTANASWWDQKLTANMERDADTERRLTSAGWLVLVVWEHEDMEEAAERVAQIVKSRR